MNLFSFGNGEAGLLRDPTDTSEPQHMPGRRLPAHKGEDWLIHKA